MTSTPLNQLGDMLQRAVAAEIATSRRNQNRRMLVVGVAVLAIAVPGIAFATSALIDEEEVAASLPAGTKALIGTDPRCTVVKPGAEYRCVLRRAPKPAEGPEQTVDPSKRRPPGADEDLTSWLGSVQPTVDATKRVNGGCRSLRADGLVWECFIGEAAVREKIIGPDFLGAYAPGPGVG
jgi:hypothetical protein